MDSFIPRRLAEELLVLQESCEVLTACSIYMFLRGSYSKHICGMILSIKPDDMHQFTQLVVPYGYFILGQTYSSILHAVQIKLALVHRKG